MLSGSWCYRSLVRHCLRERGGARLRCVTETRMETFKDNCFRELGRRRSEPCTPVRSSVRGVTDLTFTVQYGLIGSTEWGEDFEEWIAKHVVAYLNLGESLCLWTAGEDWLTVLRSRFLCQRFALRRLRIALAGTPHARGRARDSSPDSPRKVFVGRAARPGQALRTRRR